MIDAAVDRAPEVLALDGSSGDAELLGGKGAALDRLIAMGLPVPRSGAVTTRAYLDFVHADSIQSLLARIGDGDEPSAAEVDEIFVGVALPARTLEEVRRLALEVSDGANLAVRSSATVEDLEGSSFAGQYRSVLDVDPADSAAIETAVKLVFASLWHPAPRAYRAAFAVEDERATMAAVLMRMVPAIRGGVVFTVDPGNQADAARVEVVDGLAESLVSGQRTPEAFVLPRAGPQADDVPEEVAAALEAALVVEAAEGLPQDVEWAWDAERLWLVQARPITVSLLGDGFDSPIDDHELTTAGIGEMLPGVLSPMSWAVNGAMINEAFGNLVAGLGATDDDLDERPFVRRVVGRAALDFTRLRTLAEHLPGGSADELEAQYFGSGRVGRPAAEPVSAGGRWRSLVHDLRSGSLRRRANLDAEICIEAVADLAAEFPELGRLNDGELLAYRSRLLDLAMRTATAEMGVAASATTTYRKIELLVLPHLGATEAGRHAERVTTGRGIAVTPHPDSSAALFGGPTWRELDRRPPTPVVFESRTRAWNELSRALDAAETWKSDSLVALLQRRALRRIIDEAVTLLRRREATKEALLRLGGELRRVDRELGDRLVESGALETPDDVELLTPPELVAALEGTPPAGLVVSSRRRWLARYLGQPPLPLRFTGRPVTASVDLPPGGRFEGWAASPGRYEGVGVVIRSAEEDLPQGSVLVAAATDASWSPLFLRAGAIVVERGGPLSHAAILARELGVPAVLNVAGATQHLAGATVTVDGDSGVVIAHEETG